MQEQNSWEDIKSKFDGYPIKFQHTFQKQALIEFEDHKSAKRFIAEVKPELFGSFANVELSTIPTLIPPDMSAQKPSPSRVICLQLLRLQISLGIYDIYDECSHFGTVEKIICFEKAGKYALVQMHNVKEASLALANLTSSTRHLPSFQMRVQYSKNQDIIIKFNNAKSFDFTLPGALAQFEQLRHTCSSEAAFFTPERTPQVPETFDLWRPVPIDQPLAQFVKITGFEDLRNLPDQLFQLFAQYGTVQKIRIFTKPQKYALVQMGSPFYARLAMMHLNGCPWPSGKLQLSHPHYFDPATIDADPAPIWKDFTSMSDDPELSDYQEMWPPSEIVVVHGANLSEIRIPPRAVALPDRNAVQFQTILDAVIFLVRPPNSDQDSSIYMKFARP